jgi:hypothetical protein
MAKVNWKNSSGGDFAIGSNGSTGTVPDGKPCGASKQFIADGSDCCSTLDAAIASLLTVPTNTHCKEI